MSAGASSSIYNYCYDYILKYYLKIAITIGIAVGICLIKFILKHFVIFLSSFKRYRTHTEQSKDMVQNLVFVYVATTVLVTLLVLPPLSSSRQKCSECPSKRPSPSSSPTTTSRKTPMAWPSIMTLCLTGT